MSLATKYRPRTFDDVVEQKLTVDMVRALCESSELTNRNFLFIGPPGCAKTTLSRIMANVLNEGKGEPIEIDAASHSGVDKMRQIVEQASIYPVGMKYKVFIIDECHALSSAAWQSALKVLEESPAKSVFIFCVDKDGWVNTDHGMVRISDVVIGDRVWDGTQYRPVLNVFDRGTRNNCVNITFQSGNSIKCTADHKFKSLSGDIETWTEAAKLHAGDVLLRYNNIDRSMWGCEDVSEDEAFFLGYLTGNGNYDTHSMHLYTPYHKWGTLQKVLDNLVDKHIIKDYIKDSNKSSNDNLYVTRIHFFSGMMNTWYTKVGADPNYTRATKSIPKCVFQFDDAQFRAFVDGWYFADGCGRFTSFFDYQYGANGYVPYLYCSNYRMISDLSHLLESHGFYPSLRKYESVGESTPGRILSEKLVTSYTLYLNHKPGYFDNADLRAILRDKYESMPKGKYLLDLSNLKQSNRRISPKMLCEAGYNDFIARGYFDTVVSVEPCDSCHVYDIEIDTTHQFVYNGVCAHNCTTNPEKIPATILSRVQTFQISKISLDGIVSRLKYIIDCENSEGHGITYEEPAISYIAKLANGGMRDAITLLEKAIVYDKNITSEGLVKALNLPQYDDYFALLSAYAKHDNTAVAQIIHTVYNSGVNFIKWFEGFHAFVMNVVKFIFLQDIQATMIPAQYAEKVAPYGPKHSVVCLKLANKLLKLNADLKATQYLQETALTYLCTTPRKEQ